MPSQHENLWCNAALGLVTTCDAEPTLIQHCANQSWLFGGCERMILFLVGDAHTANHATVLPETMQEFYARNDEADKRQCDNVHRLPASNGTTAKIMELSDFATLKSALQREDKQQ